MAGRGRAERHHFGTSVCRTRTREIEKRGIKRILTKRGREQISKRKSRGPTWEGHAMANRPEGQRSSRRRGGFSLKSPLGGGSYVASVWKDQRNQQQNHLPEV